MVNEEFTQCLECGVSDFWLVFGMGKSVVARKDEVC